MSGNSVIPACILSPLVLSLFQHRSPSIINGLSPKPLSTSKFEVLEARPKTTVPNQSFAALQEKPVAQNRLANFHAASLSECPVIKLCMLCSSLQTYLPMMCALLLPSTPCPQNVGVCAYCPMRTCCVFPMFTQPPRHHRHPIQSTCMLTCCLQKGERAFSLGLLLYRQMALALLLMRMVLDCCTLMLSLGCGHAGSCPCRQQRALESSSHTAQLA